MNGWYGTGGEGANGQEWNASGAQDVSGAGGFGGYGNIPQLPVSSYGGEMGAPDMSGNDGQYYSGLDGGGGDYGGDGYALGGPIDGQQGGMIPTSASPSGGMVQDDVQIRAQPDEFVIPRDVALWKGQEFFQKMIAQSRARRTGAPAHGTKQRSR